MEKFKITFSTGGLSTDHAQTSSNTMCHVMIYDFPLLSKLILW